MSAACGLVLSSLPAETDARVRNFGLRLFQTLLFCLVFSIIFVPEFPHDGVDVSGSVIYTKIVGGLRFIDFAICLFAIVHVVCFACLRQIRFTIPRPFLVPGAGFMVCIVIAIWYGRSRGGGNFFFDWRGLALGMGLYVIWSFWLQSREDLVFALRLFGVYAALRISLLYVLYAAGYQERLLGVAVPLFDGPVLSGIVFSALLTINSQEYALSKGWRWSTTCLAMAASLMVLLCMRRTYWVEIAIGLLLLLILRKRHRGYSLTASFAVVAMAAMLLGSQFSQRLQSFNITRSDEPFSSDNADHLYDLVDAWEQVREAPVMGIGLGTSYPTSHIRNWKPQSVMVHNAPLHVWLKYGLAGIVCYLWFHIALLRWLYHQARTPDAAHPAFLSAAFAYLAAQFIVTLTFAPWPYSELQLTTLMSFILAAAVAASRHRPYPVSHASTIPIRHHALL